MSLHIAAYDIAKDSRRVRVAEILQEYGRRIQRSVFEIEIEPEELDDLKFRVGVLLAKTDLFDIFRSIVAFQSGGFLGSARPMPRIQ